MTNYEKIEKDCLADLNAMLKEKLTINCYIYSLCLNHITIMFKANTLEIIHNGKLKLEISGKETKFDPNDENVVEFYSAVKKFLTKKKFQDKFMKRFLEYKNMGEKMIEDKTYTKEYA